MYLPCLVYSLSLLRRARMNRPDIYTHTRSLIDEDGSGSIGRGGTSPQAEKSEITLNLFEQADRVGRAEPDSQGSYVYSISRFVLFNFFPFSFFLSPPLVSLSQLNFLATQKSKKDVTAFHSKNAHLPQSAKIADCTPSRRPLNV